MTSKSPSRMILGEDSQRFQDRDARSMNIAAARALVDTVRSTLGPAGMDKLIVGERGLVTVSNDGATILDKLEVEHPAAFMLVEVATSQEEVGDGTTTAVVLAGELLDRAEDLLEEDLHSKTIATGYLMAFRHAREYLEEIAVPVERDDTEILRNVAKTAMTGKGPNLPVDHLADLLAESISYVSNDERIDLDDIKIDSVTGKAARESDIIEGVTVHKEPLRDDMPTDLEDPKIALVDDGIEVEETETDINVRVSDSDGLAGFQDRERSDLRETVDTLLDADVDVVFASGSVDDLAQQWLVDEGVLAFRRIRDSDMRFLSRATGADIVSKVDEFDADDRGVAGSIEHRDFGPEVSDYRMFVEGCSSPESVTILLRGSTDHVVDELEGAIEDARNACQAMIDGGAVLPGGGASEVAVAMELFDFADSVSGREQLAVRAFAESLLAIPRTIAANAGADPIDTITALRNRHENGERNAGYTVEQGVSDVWEQGVIEPLEVKSRTLSTADEAAELLVRIDDVIAADELVADEEEYTGEDEAL